MEMSERKLAAKVVFDLQPGQAIRLVNYNETITLDNRPGFYILKVGKVNAGRMSWYDVIEYIKRKKYEVVNSET